MSQFKTIFVASEFIQVKGLFKGTPTEINGDQLARDVQASIMEYHAAGYRLFSSTPITSSKTVMSSFSATYTEGVLLVFEMVS